MILRFLLLLFALHSFLSVTVVNARGSKEENEMNRLQHEMSPYLRQHAENPVDWYPWGDEAFDRAASEDKPIFLSIGYSTCHWCHVMEEESFADTEVAELLNASFISIKVDREERPDIDHIYMTVSQLLTGGGGWPLNIIMTPDKRPFFAATYIPKESRGRIGMVELLPQVADAWRNRRGEIDSTSDAILEALKRASYTGVEGSEIDESILARMFDELSGQFDSVNGGFGSAPKFPSPHNLLFLLRYWHRTGNEEALRMVEATLREMRRGGIFDHVGFGFHRYSTDAGWLVPHFEKMLYDQSMIALAYIEAFQATGDAFFSETAKEIFEYVLRDMVLPGGAFASAEDADSEGEEGKFYVWEYDELLDVLGPSAVAQIESDFAIEQSGNFRDEATGADTGLNIIYGRTDSNSLDSDPLQKLTEAARRDLFARREKRIHPFKDDKVLTSWNGLMIAALARAGGVLDEAMYVEAAAKAAEFILDNLRTEDGGLLHRHRAGTSAITGYATDYAYFIFGLIELYEATFETSYLREAVVLMDRFIEEYWDDDSGGFFLTADDAESLLVRPREDVDSAIPSANSVAFLGLFRLARMTQNLRYEEHARALSDGLSGVVGSYPSAFGFFLSAYDLLVGPSFEVVIAGDPDSTDTIEMARRLRREFTPRTVILFRPDGEAPAITEIAPFVRFNVSINGKATAYVCKDYACELPVTTAEEMLALLRAGRRG